MHLNRKYHIICSLNIFNYDCRILTFCIEHPNIPTNPIWLGYREKPELNDMIKVYLRIIVNKSEGKHLVWQYT